MKNFIVPYDFKSAGRTAFAYAQTLLPNQDSMITLLYIAKDEDDLKRAEHQFEQIKQAETFRIESKVVIGNLIDDLSKQAVKANGSAVIMAIYSESGLQKVFGTRAIKVITDSKIPFLIIQNKHGHANKSNIDKIAVTVDSNEESIQILSSVVHFSETFDSEIILVGGNNEDNSKKRKIDANISKMSTQLKTNHIKHEVVYLPTKKFEDELMSYSKAHGINLVAVTYYKDNSTLFSSNFVQSMLENKEGIPVLTIGGIEIPAFQKIMSNVVCPISIEKINSKISRTTVFLNVILMLAFLVTYNPIFAYIVAVDYFIRASIGGKYSPIMYIAKMIVKSLNLKTKLINLAPKVFASRLGFLCALAAVVFFQYDSYLGAMISMSMLAILSFMDSVLNFCVGCVIYNYLVYPLFKFRIR